MMSKDIFASAMVAGGDFSKKTAEEFYENVNPEESPTYYLDLFLCSALKGDSSQTDIGYAIHQLQSALKML